MNQPDHITDLYESSERWRRVQRAASMAFAFAMFAVGYLVGMLVGVSL